jgi:hypothetical protein
MPLVPPLQVRQAPWLRSDRRGPCLLTYAGRDVLEVGGGENALPSPRDAPAARYAARVKRSRGECMRHRARWQCRRCRCPGRYHRRRRRRVAVQRSVPGRLCCGRPCSTCFGGWSWGWGWGVYLERGEREGVPGAQYVENRVCALFVCVTSESGVPLNKKKNGRTAGPTRACAAAGWRTRAPAGP